ncbi:MAG: acyl-[acyl-carrier-protein] thioesterase [Acidimicrobiales bacterium]
MLDEALVPLPAAGRVYAAGRRVRLSDIDVDGRFRLDAAARYLQDVAGDDAADSGIEATTFTWVVRRTVIDVHSRFGFREWADLTTWCSGTGGRWAARRTSMVGDRGGRLEAEAVWICVDLTTQAPARLPDAFHRIYGPSAGGRKVSTRLRLGAPHDGATTSPWPLRATDHDILEHMNNAAYWEAVEERLRRHGPLLAAPHRAVMEFGPGVAPDDTVVLRVDEDADRLAVWFVDAGVVQASALVTPLDSPGPR